MKQYWAGAVVVAVIALSTAWFLSTRERVVETVPAAYEGEARFNRFLAAEMLLQELGINADSRASLVPSAWLPDTTDTIVVQLATAFSAGQEAMTLERWISNGGHLVLLPPRQATRQSGAWLESLGFRFVRADLDEDDSENGNAEDQRPTYNAELDASWYRVEIVDVQGPMATLPVEDGQVAVRREWGDGFVTILAPYALFNNDNLAETDHARLLLDVVAGYVEPGKVWFIYNAVFPPLWAVIWNHAPLLVLGLTVLFLVWLWSVMPAFGPRIKRRRDARRSIAEHVKAAGLFVWRHQGADVLAKSTTEALLHDAELKHPGLSRLPVASQAQVIARMTDMSEQSVLDVLANQGDLRHREFTHDIQRLQSIRKEL